jgi:hypothetical protein
MNKKLPTISIKGRDYVMVKDRITAFNELFPNGCIDTVILKDDEKSVLVRATVRTEAGLNGRNFTGHSEAYRGVGQMGQVPVEVAETSAVGRALAMLGIGIVQSVSSGDEINKATQTVNKIQSGEKFTADEYEDALDVLPDEAYGAVTTAKQLLKKPVQYKPRSMDKVREGIRERGESDL